MTSLAPLLSHLKKLVALETTASQSVVPALDYAERIMMQHGMKTKRVMKKGDRIGCLLGRLGPHKEGGIVFAGHLDVVSPEGQNWTTPPYELTDKGEKLYGRGTCDMKGFIACLLTLLPEWEKASPETPITFAFSGDEETNNSTILDLIGLFKNEPKPRGVIVGEPTGMNIVTMHKGTHGFFLDIEGKEAHSSHPELGVNAILVAHDIISYWRKIDEALHKGPQDKRYDPPTATINVGKIEGGTAANIIPNRCTLAIQLRQIVNDEATRLEEDFRNFLLTDLATLWPGAKIKLRIGDHAPALEEPKSSLFLRSVAKELAGAAIGSAAFGTEAGFFQEAGGEALVIGPGNIAQAHKADEYVTKAQLERCISFLKGIAAP